MIGNNKNDCWTPDSMIGVGFGKEGNTVFTPQITSGYQCFCCGCTVGYKATQSVLLIKSKALPNTCNEPSTCTSVTWNYTSTPAWNVCPPGMYLNGFYKSEVFNGYNDAISLLTKVSCCEPPTVFSGQRTERNFPTSWWKKDSISSSVCPDGFAFQSLKFHGANYLSDITTGACERPLLAKDQFADCYKLNTKIINHQKGWMKCKPCYVITALQKGPIDTLSNLDSLHCCKLDTNNVNAPSILVNQSNASGASLFKPYHLTCDGADAYLTVYWFFQGKAISNNSSTIEVDTNKFESQGLYTCAVVFNKSTSIHSMPFLVEYSDAVTIWLAFKYGAPSILNQSVHNDIQAKTIKLHKLITRRKRSNTWYLNGTTKWFTAKFNSQKQILSSSDVTMMETLYDQIAQNMFLPKVDINTIHLSSTKYCYKQTYKGKQKGTSNTKCEV
jgi:hypothetical protein